MACPRYGHTSRLAGWVLCSTVAVKEILIIAGPNGAGKTTFAFRYLRPEQRGIPFVNADLIASGLDPTEPGRADIQVGRLMLAELDRHTRRSQLRLRDHAVRAGLPAQDPWLAGGWLSRLADLPVAAVGGGCGPASRPAGLARRARRAA